MHAESYQITFGYKATDGQFYGPNGSVGPYHRGEDRAMPEGTPIIVNGLQIGLSGNTGASSGPHLHIGRFLGGNDTDPGGGGFHFGSAVVTEINEDAVNGKYVRVQADGASWVYLHMSVQTTFVGHQLVEQVAPAPPPIYTIDTSTRLPHGQPLPKEVVLNKDTQRYNLTTDPVTVETTSTKDERFTVVAVLHHINGQDYFLADASVASGFNVSDCEDYIAPPPPPAPLPTGALQVPVLTSQYEVITAIKAYPSATDAQNGTKAAPSLVEPGIYVRYPTPETTMAYISLTSGTKCWINPADNVIPVIVPDPPKPSNWTDPRSAPVPPVDPPLPTSLPSTYSQPNQWKSTYKSFRDIFGEVMPINYKMLEDYQIVELEKLKTIHLEQNQIVEMAGVFTKDGIEYLRPQGAVQAFTWYGIPDDGQVTLPHDPLHQSEEYLETEFQPVLHALSAAERWFSGTIKLKTIGKSIMDIKRRK
jgi:hypothetical protein